VIREQLNPDHALLQRYRRLHRAHPSITHTVKVATKLNNLDTLEEVFHRVSDPSHEDYGKHWTKEEIGHLIKNEVASSAIIAYFEGEGCTVKGRSLLDEILLIEGRVEVWERILSTEFFEFEEIQEVSAQSEISGDRETSTIIRATEYSLPSSLDAHIMSIFDVVDIPLKIADVTSESQILPEVLGDVIHSLSSTTRTVSGYVTPALLTQQYRIRSNVGSTKTSQGIYMPKGKTMSPTDLTSFQQAFTVPVQGITAASTTAGGVSNDACSTTSTTSSCSDGNLVSQYLEAMAWYVPTTYFYNPNDSEKNHYQDVVMYLTSLVNPPKVLVLPTINTYEADVSPTYILAFNYLAIQLGVMGVTLIVSAGNDGAPSSRINGKPSICAYTPLFPASSPYVLTVGATQGPEVGSSEVTAQRSSDGTSVPFTTGGGFSLRNPRPAWQNNAVSSYITTVRGTTNQPSIGYSTSGRGYPDISAMGNKYLIRTGSILTSVSTTAASTAVIAGMISLINSGRQGLGKSSMGFTNPFLYSSSASSLFINDIQSGHNKCTSSGTCCREGFTAVSGWDPVSGLGSVKDFQVFYSTAVYGSLSIPPTSPPALRPHSILKEEKVEEVVVKEGVLTSHLRG
jgi:tripeptidyl-peptidase-1